MLDHRELKVLVVSSKYPPEYSGSGLRAHKTYLRLQNKYNVNFEVVCSSTASNLSKKYQLDGINVERIVSKSTRNIERTLLHTPVRRITKALVAYKEAQAVRKKLADTSFDMIHTFGYSPATMTAISWSRSHQIPLALEIVNPVSTPYQPLPGIGIFSKQDLNHQCMIVAISESIGEMCATHGLANNVWVRPNPVDTSRFSIPSSETKAVARNKISSAGPNEKLIVYVAKYITRKNHSFLIDVMALLPKSYRLVLAGPPLTDRDPVPGLTASEIPSLEKKASKLGVHDRVEISHGFVDMAQYIAAADVFCFPAENEAMGTPILESISSGVPVVANANEPSFQEWIEEGENGYLAQLEPILWAKLITKAAEFSLDKKAVMASKVNSIASTDLVDSQYYQLPQSLIEITPKEQLNVSRVLA